MADTIKEFLVSLGYKIDEPSQNKFRKGVSDATDLAFKLGKAAIGAGDAVAAFVLATAREMDKLYFASQRTGASAAAIQDFGLSIKNMGGSVEGAVGSMENLGRFIRTNPGAEALLTGVGVKPENLSDMSKVMEDLSTSFRNMPVYLAEAYAAMLGIDEATMLAMRSGEKLGETYKTIYKNLGVDADKATEGLHELNKAMNEFVGGTQALTTGWVSKFSDEVLGLINRLKLGNEAMAHFTGTKSMTEGFAPQASIYVNDKIRRGLQSAKNFSISDFFSEVYDNSLIGKLSGNKNSNSEAPENIEMLQLPTKEDLMTGSLARDKSNNDMLKQFPYPTNTPLLGNIPPPPPGIVINQDTTINVTGSDPAATSKMVATEQAAVNSQLTRNLKGAVQ